MLTVYYVIIKEFQSTLPLRGATLYTIKNQMSKQISIHAPLAGSDPEGEEDT